MHKRIVPVVAAWLLSLLGVGPSLAASPTVFTDLQVSNSLTLPWCSGYLSGNGNNQVTCSTTLPLLGSANTWTQPQTFSADATVTGDLMVGGRPSGKPLAYLMASFSNNYAATFLHVSADLMKWHPIAPNGVYCDPNCGGITTRDTSITQDPVTKQWLLFYTSGTNYFSWAYSSNLINWAYGGTVSTAAAGSVTGTGAPEAFWDSDGTFHVFVAVGFGADSAHNYQIYETHPTTAHNYSSWSAPVALSGNWAANVTNSSNIMVIDPFMVKIGSTYYLWYADGSAAQAGGYMTYATSSNVMGPYTRATAAGDWAGWGANNDGETLVQVDTNKWSICFEDLNDDYWCSTSTSGFTGWSPKAKPSSPIKLRHGTIVPIYSMDTLRQVTAASLSWMDYGRNSGLPLPSGYIGETISNSFCANSGMSNGNALNITSITVPSGVWLVTGTAGLNTNGSITVTYANGGTSNSSATSPNTGNRWDYPGTITVNGALEFATPTQTINTASPMTLYQVIAANFSGSGTAGGCGAITARRLQ